MFYLEAYKFFKRKLVCVLSIGLFLLAVVPTIVNILYLLPDYGKLQQKVDTYEKYNGTFTESNVQKFLEDYEETLSNEEMKELEYEDAHLKMLADTLPDIDFDIIFGYYEQWLSTLVDSIIQMQYIPVFVAIAFSGIFTYDKSCGMQEIMLSARNGRKKCTKTKVLLAFLVTNTMFLLIAFIAVLRICILTQGRGWNTSIQMAIWLSESPLDMSFLLLWLHTLFLTFLAINVILLITLSVSFLAKNPETAMCISLGALFLLRPDVLNIFIRDKAVISKIVSLTPYNIIDTSNLAQQIPMTIGRSTVQWIYIVEVLYMVLLAVGGIFFFKKLIRHHKYFAS